MPWVFHCSLYSHSGSIGNGGSEYQWVPDPAIGCVPRSNVRSQGSRSEPGIETHGGRTDSAKRRSLAPSPSVLHDRLSHRNTAQDAAVRFRRGTALTSFSVAAGCADVRLQSTARGCWRGWTLCRARLAFGEVDQVGLNHDARMVILPPSGRPPRHCSSRCRNRRDAWCIVAA